MDNYINLGYPKPIYLYNKRLICQSSGKTELGIALVGFHPVFDSLYSYFNSRLIQLFRGACAPDALYQALLK